MKRRIILTSMTFLGAMGLYAAPASAQATRTWVSGVGDDVNPCSRTAPCKTFAGAISKTAPGGEINCLDPAGFGAVTLTKSVTIDCTGTLGGVLASSTTGVILNGAGIIVTLRGLEINGGPPNLPGVNGIRFLQGLRLSVEDSTIYNFLGAAPNGFGILVNNTSTTVQLYLRNTVIRNNGTAVSGGGIGVIPTGTGAARVELDNVSVLGNAFVAVSVNTNGATGNGVQMTIRNSQFSGASNGISLTATGTSAAQANVFDSQLFNNQPGSALAANGGLAFIRAGGNTIIGNGSAVSAAGGASIRSFGDNRVDGNSNASTFTPPNIDPQ